MIGYIVYKKVEKKDLWKFSHYEVNGETVDFKTFKSMNLEEDNKFVY